MLIALPNAFGDAATNMAIDAALLATLPKGLAVFRHYGWTEPAITFGYTQAYAPVRKTLESDLTFCRRLTGGGIVDHRNDWTYALILRNDIAAARTPANELYTLIHRAIQRALSKQSVETQLAPCPRQCGEPPNRESPAPSQCFVTPAASDVLLQNGRKIAGAAMKRTKDGLLIQGSIDRATLPEQFPFEDFKASFIEALCSALDLQIGIIEDLRTLFDGERIQTERLRFESDAWLQRR
jgi:lipoyl(octanoyl) transferase